MLHKPDVVVCVMTKHVAKVINSEYIFQCIYLILLKINSLY